MNETIIATVISIGTVTGALFGLGALLVCVWLLKTHAREVDRVVAQADERVSVLLASNERMVSRVVAMAFPNSHANYRRNSGTVDGAQHRVKPHYAEEQQLELFERAKKEAEQAQQQAQQVRDALRAEMAVPESKAINTQLDFEGNGAS